MEKGQIIELRIDDMLEDGRAFGRVDGIAVFVDGGGVVGDTIRAKVTKAKKNAIEAKLVMVTQDSECRVDAACPYFCQCGGCTLQEINYEKQLEIKHRHVTDKLTRLGGLENPKINPVIAAENLNGYRNKATFAVGPHGEVGFLKNRSHFVVDVEDCVLQSKAAMACAAALREFLHGKAGCITQMIVKTAFTTGEVMVVLESTKKDIPGIERLVELLDDYCTGTVLKSPNGQMGTVLDTEAAPSDVILSSLESVSVICNNKCRTVAGKPTIIEEVTSTDGDELRFEISPQSFYQVNPEQMVKLYGKALEYADLKGNETVLDLYCGVGTIGIFAAAEMNRRQVTEMGRVIGIETVKPAILDANRNSVINGIINTRYICGKAEEELPGMMGLAKLYKYNEVNELVEREPEIKLTKADVAIVDPPRAGCDEALLSAVVTAQPDRIVYVSCDAGTLARDIKYLCANGYKFIEATPVDMFPLTGHVETVCLLSNTHKKKESYITLDVEMDDYYRIKNGENSTK